MSRTLVRTAIITILLVSIGLFSNPTPAKAAYGDETWVIHTVASFGCNSGESNLLSTITNLDVGQPYRVWVEVFSGGLRRMNQYIDFTPNRASSIDLRLNLFSIDNGPQNITTWSTATPWQVRITLYNPTTTTPTILVRNSYRFTCTTGALAPW